MDQREWTGPETVRLNPDGVEESPLQVGDAAPSFEVKGVHNGTVRTYALSDLIGDKSLLLGFYAFDLSPANLQQMYQLRQMEWYLYKNALSIVGVSTDRLLSHAQFSGDDHFGFPLLSDTDRSLARRYGVVRPASDGMSEEFRPAIFLIDATGTITYRWVAETNCDEDGVVFTADPIQDAIRHL